MKKLYVAFIICVFVLTITPQAQPNYKPSLLATSAHLQANLVNAGNWLPAGCAPTVTIAVSRKSHGGAGTFDITLPLVPISGAVGIEDRTGAVAGAHQMVVTFATSVTVSGVSVTSGTGSATFSVAGAVVTINLTGVTNAQRLGVTLSNVSDGTTNTGGDVFVPMGVLSGDTNASGGVSAADVAQTKAQSGVPVTAANFREDVNASGSVNAGDVALVKSKSGTSLPPAIDLPSATTIGADPVISDGVSTQAVDPSGTAISLTEGNLMESQVIGGTNCDTCPSCCGKQAPPISTHGISFTMTYNSRDADGSRAQLSTVAGLGWTHSFNVFLFSQAGSIFRFDGNGRVTKYVHNPDDTYTADTGYFETMVRTSCTTFLLTQKDQTRFTFSVVPGTPFTVGGAVYRLTEIRDRNNDTVTLTYGGGNLLNVADTYGRTINFTYDANHNVASVTDPLLRTTMFTYDPAGTHLSSITDPVGMTVMYTYNGLNQLTSKTDKDGRLFSYSYTNNKPTASTDGVGGLNFSLSNPSNWSIDPNLLREVQLLVYLPSTTTETDGRTNHWSYQYDFRAYVTNVTAPDNALTGFMYDDATRRVASVTDANSHTTQYQYDSQGNRTMITLSAPFNYVTMFEYEPMFNMMTRMTDPRNRVTSYSYDSRGNRTMETDPLLQTRQWTYDADGNVLTETDKRGNTTTYTYDAGGNRNSITAPSPLGYVTTMTYDGVGNLKTRTDPNNHTTMYDYDGLNRRINQRDPAGQLDQYQYDGESHRTMVTDRNNHSTMFQYDRRGRLTRMTDALTHLETYNYDGNNNRIVMTDKNGHATTSQYDVQNRLSMTTDAVGNRTSMAYDPVGNMTSMTDANAHTTGYTYDALNRRSTITDALGYLTTFGYDTGTLPNCNMCGATPGSSLITKQTDGNGKVTYFKFDQLDCQIKVVRKEGDVDDVIDPSDAVTSYAYDPNNNQVTMTEPDNNTTTYQYDVLNRRTGETNAAGDITQFSYDGADNLTTMTAPNLNVTTNTYDLVDRLTQVEDSVARVMSYSYDFVGNRLTRRDGNNNTTTYSYDAINRLVATIDPLNQSTTTMYDPVGNVLNVTDREGNMTTHVYDNINRRTSTIDALHFTTHFQYDAVGNLTIITDANGHFTQYHYDNINRRIMEIYADPPPNTRTFVYDAVNMISRSDQRGQTTNYMYNDLYFLLHRTYPVSPADNMTYDLSGRMVTGERGGWTVTFAYDGANRVTQTVQNGNTIGYSYNIPGRTRMLTYPSGRQITENTDARTRLDHIDDGGSSPIVQYSYDLGNRVGTRFYRNGANAFYSYNSNDWILSLQHFKGPTLIAGFSYDFDREGNKKFERKGHDLNHSESYQYDDGYRLVNYKVAPVPGPTPIITQTSYNLDMVGNWNSKTTDGVTQTRMHNAANELTRIDTTNLLYDDNGNLQNDGTYTYSYDEEDRLTQVRRNSDNAVVAQYQYDALGRRVNKLANPVGTPVDTRYSYDDARTIEEESSIGPTLATYVYGNYIDEVLSMDRGGQTVFYHQNSLWSVEAITDATGAPIERYSYDAYGQPSVFDGSGTPIPPNPWGTPHSAIGNPWLFTGRQLDEETGPYFYRARYLNQYEGRFITRDPIGIWGDPDNLGNGYAYVANNPISRVDPLGQSYAMVPGIWNTLFCDVPGSTSHAMISIEGDVGTQAWRDSRAHAIEVCHYLGGIVASGDGNTGATSASNTSLSLAAAGDGIGGVDTFGRKKRGGALYESANYSSAKSNTSLYAAAAGDGIGGVDVGLKKCWYDLYGVRHCKYDKQ